MAMSSTAFRMVRRTLGSVRWFSQRYRGGRGFEGRRRVAPGLNGEFPAAEDHAPTQYHLQNLRRAFLNRGCDRMRDAYSGMMVTGVRPTLEMFHELLDLSGRRGAIQDMMEYWEDMMEFGLRPDGRAWDLMLAGCSKAKDAELGFQIWNWMKVEKAPTSSSTYANLLHFCSLSVGYYDRAPDIWGDMVERGIKPTGEVISSVINCCRARGDYEGGKRVFKEMPIDADIHSYNAIIHLCVDEGNFKEAQEYYDRLCAIRSPNAITYSHLVLGYYRTDQGERALQILDTMKDLDMYVGRDVASEIARTALQSPTAENLSVTEGLLKYTSPNNWSVYDASVLKAIFPLAMQQSRLDIAQKTLGTLLSRRELTADEARTWPQRVQRRRAAATE